MGERRDPQKQTAGAQVLAGIDPARPVLIAGPTASGKSALALALAERQGGVIVNADASQVYDCWHILSARPDAEEERRAPHRLYGHVAANAPYSVGHWLRDVAPLLGSGSRLIIVGGTGLYFKALTEGLADIPAVPDEIRAQAVNMSLDAMLGDLDAATRRQIDTRNPARVQRAWGVLRATGRGLAAWQADAAPPLLPLSQAEAIAVHAPRDWLNARIAGRFDRMIALGVLDEVRAVEPTFDPARPAHRAIGARELVAHLRGELGLDAAKDLAVIATRQFAKRQRTWLRSGMDNWTWVDPS